jgi:chemotaxis protein methyltransferase CheR
MDDATFGQFRTIIHDLTGIALNQNKKALVCSRIGKRMRALNIINYRDYLQYILLQEDRTEMSNLVDAITTNVTSFFREAGHFEYMKKILTEWHRDKQRKFRLWSAACSSGEEPYSMTMTLFETIPDIGSIDCKILATDISLSVLKECHEASYDCAKLKMIPPFIRDKYFKIENDSQKSKYRVEEKIKKAVVFRRFNLTVIPYPMKGNFDIIFCRNVMIYFDNDTRKKIIDEMYRLLKPEGYLFIGHSESLMGLSSEFKCIKPSIYVKQ